MRLASVSRTSDCTRLECNIAMNLRCDALGMPFLSLVNPGPVRKNFVNQKLVIQKVNLHLKHALYFCGVNNAHNWKARCASPGRSSVLSQHQSQRTCMIKTCGYIHETVFETHLTSVMPSLQLLPPWARHLWNSRPMAHSAIARRFISGSRGKQSGGCRRTCAIRKRHFFLYSISFLAWTRHSFRAVLTLSMVRRKCTTLLVFVPSSRTLLEWLQ